MRIIAVFALFSIIVSYVPSCPQLTTGQTEKVCRSQTDCEDYACCVADADKRKAHHRERFIFRHDSGFCRPKRYQGLTCHVFLQQSRGIYNDYCPCDDGLTCQGTHILPNGHHTNPKCIPSDEAVSHSTKLTTPTATSSIP